METRKGLVTIAEFEVDDIISRLPRDRKRNCDEQFIVKGKKYIVRMNSSRYFTFRDSTKCVCCGLEGVKFKLQTSERRSRGQPRNRAHFNLFGMESDGTEVMLTKDHIKPKSLGGANSPNNYQTMCMVCNSLKGDDEEISMEDLRGLKKKWLDQDRSTKKKKKRKSKTKSSKSKARVVGRKIVGYAVVGRKIVGYALLRMDARRKRRTEKVLGLFFSDEKRQAAGKVSSFIQAMGVKYYCVESGQLAGVWPAFKLLPLAEHVEQKGKQWRDMTKKEKNEHLGRRVMGWAMFKKPGEESLYWKCANGAIKKVSSWRPAERKRDFARVERELAKKSLVKRYEAFLGDEESLDSRCQAAIRAAKKPKKKKKKNKARPRPKD